MFHSQLRILFQPIVDLHRHTPAAFEASFRLHGGGSASRLFERARAAGRSVEIEGEATELAIRLARRLPEGALSLNLSAELIEADPDWLRTLLLTAERPIWIELNNWDPIADESAIAALRIPGRISLVLDHALVPEALLNLVFLAPEVAKVSSLLPQEPLLSLARHLGVQLCRDLVYDEPDETLIAAGYTLAQGRRFGLARESSYWAAPARGAGSGDASIERIERGEVAGHRDEIGREPARIEDHPTVAGASEGGERVTGDHLGDVVEGA